MKKNKCMVGQKGTKVTRAKRKTRMDKDEGPGVKAMAHKVRKRCSPITIGRTN